MNRLPLDKIPKRTKTIRCVIEKGETGEYKTALVNKDDVTETIEFQFGGTIIRFKTIELKKLLGGTNE